MSSKGITCIVKTIMLLTLLLSFHKYLTGVKGGRSSGLLFANLPTLFEISITLSFGTRLHDVFVNC